MYTVCQTEIVPTPNQIYFVIKAIYVVVINVSKKKRSNYNSYEFKSINYDFPIKALF